MSLSDDRLAAIRAEVGRTTPPTDSDLEDKYDRLGSLNAVILEVLNEQLSALLSSPAQLNVTGFSQNTSANIAALQKQVDKVAARTQVEQEAVSDVIRSVPIRGLRPGR